ncbi:MAG: hypothetical protein LJF15_06395 [Acidobacteria bacterium]|jgi:hypothetical protein|nr:hypothetical protein [Acidobacteriota bacterium]
MSTPTMPTPPSLGRLQRNGLAFGAVFLLGLAVGFFLDRHQFFRSYLFGWLFWLGIAVGCLGLAMLNQLTGGLWGLVPRRFHEAAARTLPTMAVLFVPVLLGLGSLYVWSRPEVVAADEIIRSKTAYLNVPFFVARAALYFAVWSGLALLVSRWSTQQDGGIDPARAGRLRGVSGVGLVALSGTTTFAAIDWGMSLAPHWFSTMYGVLFIVGWTLSALSFTIVLMARLSRESPMSEALQPGTVHDLGKLLLAFTMLWAYVNFSQFLIVWSGNISEETPFYVQRMHGGWGVIAVVLLLFHFALPFALLLSRPLKRHARSLAIVAGLMLVMQLVDLYWLIGPDLLTQGRGHAPLRFHWMDLASALGFGGLWLFLFARQVRTRPVLPLAEPAVRALVDGPQGAEVVTS